MANWCHIKLGHLNEYWVDLDVAYGADLNHYPNAPPEHRLVYLFFKSGVAEGQGGMPCVNMPLAYFNERILPRLLAPRGDVGALADWLKEGNDILDSSGTHAIILMGLRHNFASRHRGNAIMGLEPKIRFDPQAWAVMAGCALLVGLVLTVAAIWVATIYFLVQAG